MQLFVVVATCGHFEQALKLGAEDDLFTGRRKIGRPPKFMHSLVVCASANTAPSAEMMRVCRGQRGMAVLLLWAWALCFVSPTPRNTKVDVVCELHFLDPLTNLVASWSK